MAAVRTLMSGLIVLALACDSGTPAGRVTGPGDFRLEDLDTWGGQGRFLVSPRPHPDGRSILVAGPGGRGTLRIDRADGQIAEVAARPGENVTGLDGFTQLPGAAALGIRHEAYSGRLTLTVPGRERVLAGHGAWGVAVAPGGRGVAFCTGPLREAWLTVVDGQGRSLFSGPGAQPAWSPDGRLLIYSVPEPAAEPARGLAGAELVLLEPASGRSWDLTDTPGRTEMQPVFTPEGEVLYADWRHGTVHLARLTGPEVGP